MESTRIKYSILITTKNRLEDLLYTLSEIRPLLQRDDTECIICDDGSTDGTFETVQNQFPEVQLMRNETSKGLIFSRNRMLNAISSDYAISLDDDANFLTASSLELIDRFFEAHPKCGVQSFRIFWSTKQPHSITSKDESKRVKSFVGCGHVWRMKAWKEIPDYPAWFIFYGEEDFAALQLFKKGWEVHYNPEVLVHHRVDLSARKNNKDYQLRQRRALRAGWYLYFMFYPWKVIPRKLAYTLWIQLKTKVFKGSFKATMAILQAMGDVLVNMPKLISQSNRLTSEELNQFSKLPAFKVYWNPEDES
ncbi:glycosyltransferase family 2 protein [Flavobacterium pedocola]